MKTLSMLVLAGLVVFAGCARKEAAPTDTRRAVAMLDAHLSLGEAITVDNLTVWPVFTDAPLDLGEFLTLQEAIEKEVAEVREVGGQSGQQTAQVILVQEEMEEPEPETPEEEIIETPPLETAEVNGNDANDAFQGPGQNAAIGLGGGASVNTLVIENKSDLPILICAGTVVKGGNQDRQIGQDIVIKAGSSVPVDAFCVEQGRWNSQRLGEVTDGKFHGVSTNAMIGVRTKGQYELAQNEVWEEVAKVKKSVITKINATPAAPPEQQALVVANSSLAIAQDAYDMVTGKEIDALCAKVRTHFASFGQENAPVGFAYAVNGKPANVRSFAHSRVFSKQFDPFLRSMATEAMLADEIEHEAPLADQVVALVKEIQQAEEALRKTAAMNRNGVRENQKGYAANCYVPAKDSEKEVVVTRDWTAK